MPTRHNDKVELHSQTKRETIWGITFLPEQENVMSRRYLMLMQRWTPFGMKYFKEWPDRPNCGHFFGGVYWYGRETMQPLLMLALVTSSPEYDSEITGFSRDELIKTAIKALRYLCFTHDAGPVEGWEK